MRTVMCSWWKLMKVTDQVTRKCKYTLWLVDWRNFQLVQTSSHLIHFQWKMSRYKSGNKPSKNYHSLGIQLSTHFKYFGQSLNSQLRWTSLVSPQLWSWLCWSWQALARQWEKIKPWTGINSVFQAESAVSTITDFDGTQFL